MIACGCASIKEPTRECPLRGYPTNRTKLRSFEKSASSMAKESLLVCKVRTVLGIAFFVSTLGRVSAKQQLTCLAILMAVEAAKLLV